MPRIYACDHCGRAGDVTMGVYYPNKDITQPAVRLCQTYQGSVVTPNCYHLVVERGEQLGIRKVNAIMETDRQSPKNEGVTLRFAQGDSGGNVILTETEAPPDAPSLEAQRQQGLRARNVEDGLTPYGEMVQGEHPMTGQRIPLVPEDRDFEISNAITEAEKGKGIIDPYGASQKSIIDPASPEGQQIADDLAEEQARKITVPVSGPRMNPQGQTVDFPRPPDNQPISPSDMVYSEPQPGPKVDTTNTVIDPAGNVVSGEQPAAAQTPAEVAAEAQREADEEEAAKRKPKGVDNPQVHPETGELSTPDAYVDEDGATMRPLTEDEPRSEGATHTVDINEPIQPAQDSSDLPVSAAPEPNGNGNGNEAARQASEQEAVDKAAEAAESAQEASDAAQDAVDKAPAKKAPAKKAAKKAAPVKKTTDTAKPDGITDSSE